jgi:hypothetical protein
MAELSGYHFYMDRLRSEGKLVFWCACETTSEVLPGMPLLMKCLTPCTKYMIVMDKNDLP